MTIRSVLLGFGLGLGIAVFAFFNDQVIRQTLFIGNHFPMSVFGVLVALVFIVNPLLGKIRRNLSFRPMELAVVTAISLAACGWAGSSFFRVFVASVALPGHSYGAKSAWQAARVMSYVPGCSPEIGEGHLADPVDIAGEILAAAEEGVPASPAQRIALRLDSSQLDLLRERVAAGGFSQSEKSQFVDMLNVCILDTGFYDKAVFSSVEISPAARNLIAARTDSTLSDHESQLLNRHLLVAAFPGKIGPLPRGEGHLLAHARADSPALTTLLEGWEEKKRRMRISDIPWKEWWPTVRLYGLLAILFSLAPIFLITIVQPQWRRELLPYPVANFVRDLVAPSKGGFLPKVAKSKVFWFGFWAMVVIHFVNGLQAWFPNFVTIPLQFNFGALWPVLGTWPWLLGEIVLRPTLRPTVVAFMFFLRSQVSFSAGIAAFSWYILLLIMEANGATLEGGAWSAGNFTFMHFGAYLGTALMMLYVGRRYYFGVLAGTLGFRRSDETPPMAVWSLRALIVCIILIVIILAQNGLDWVVGSSFVLLTLLSLLVMSRVNAETGLFFLQVVWAPLAVLLGIFGVQALGPTVVVCLGLFGFMFCGDLRTTLMPYVVNSMEMVTEKRRMLPRGGLVTMMAVIAVASFFAALAATLYFQYRYGFARADRWPTAASGFPFNALTRAISELTAYDELVPSVAVNGLERFSAMRPVMKVLPWGVAGVVLVLLCSFMRTRFSWWPLHPIFFLIWGTYHPGRTFTFSILLGWIVKVLVVKLGGARGYHAVKPLMIGVIAGELLIGLAWIVVGAIYYFATGLVPASYWIFPS